MALSDWVKKAADLAKRVKPKGAEEKGAEAQAPSPQAPARPTGQTQAARGGAPRRAVQPPPPRQKEDVFSTRRIAIYTELIALIGTLVFGFKAYQVLMGGWPSGANFFPPRVKSFEGVSALGMTRNYLWVADEQGLTRVRLGRRVNGFRDFTGNLPSPEITVLKGGTTQLWVGTTKGLVRYDGRGFRKLKKTPLAKLSITAIERDSAGRIWAATSENGLFAGGSRGWRHYEESLPSPYVTALAPASKGGIWAGHYTGGILRIDGDTIERLRLPAKVNSAPIAGIVEYRPGRILVLTESALYETHGGDTSKVTFTGLKPKETLAGISDSEPFGVCVSTSTGRIFRFDARKISADEFKFPKAARILSGVPGYLLVGTGDSVFRLGDGPPEPLTDWASFMNLGTYRSPVADVPLDWGDSRFKSAAGLLAWAVFLLAAVFHLRSIRWKYSAERYAWRIGALRWAEVLLIFLGVLFTTQYFGLVSVRSWEILWLPFWIVAAVWLIVHFFRTRKHEWAERQDTFWMGFSFAVGTIGIWLWWGQGRLLPAIIVCSIGGLFLSRSLRGLREGKWRGGKLAWGVVLFLFQAFALLPPLVFAGMMWGTAAFNMGDVAELASDLDTCPNRMSWMADGNHAVYTVPNGKDLWLCILDGRARGWKIAKYSLPSMEVYPAPCPDSQSTAVSYRQDADTIVELVGNNARRLWLTRIPGIPVPGWQPCWEKDGKSMVVLTRNRLGTTVWRLRREKGDADRVMSSGMILSWPSISGDGDSLVCSAGEDGYSSLVVLDFESRQAKRVEPTPYKKEPLLVFSPTEEGKAVLRFLTGIKAGIRGALGLLKNGIQGLLRILGFKVNLPEFWIQEGWFEGVEKSAAIDWREYGPLREVMLSADGRSIACIGRRKGLDRLLHMPLDGSGVRVLFKTDGRLSELKWSPYKNRLMVIEEKRSILAPYAVRRLLMIEGLPEKLAVKSIVPFAKWISAPCFSPDGARLVYSATGKFWSLSLWPLQKYGVYQMDMELQMGILGPTQAAKAAKGGESSH